MTCVIGTVQDGTDNSARGPCEICGEPATCISQDLEQVPSQDGWACYKARGPQHLRCDDHLRDAETWCLNGEGQLVRGYFHEFMNSLAFDHLARRMRLAPAYQIKRRLFPSLLGAEVTP